MDSLHPILKAIENQCSYAKNSIFEGFTKYVQNLGFTQYLSTSAVAISVNKSNQHLPILRKIECVCRNALTTSPCGGITGTFV
jgi:hypothetical protein